jgi:4-hydroxythreonine-4-phosphate dehydrogenase
MENRIKVGITLGDYNGIGAEVIIKTLEDDRIFRFCDIVIYGHKSIISHYTRLLKIQNFQVNEIKDLEKLNSKIPNVLNCWEGEVVVKPGESTIEAGEKSILALNRAVNDLIEKQIDVLVTGPVNKSNIAQTQTDFKGQTEYIALKSGSENSLMLLADDALKVGLVSNHVPLKDVVGKIDMMQIINKLEILNKTLKQDFLIDKPKIAVLGLNPHSGDNGLLGKEEKEIIAPAVQKARDKGILAMGPYPADGFFGMHQYLKFDAVLAMYHDQGLIPFKALAFGSGVNFTAGIDVIRTSPDHGTGYDIAGQDKATADSLRAAIFMGIDIFKNRENYKEMTANPIERVHLRDEREN